ncbi:MAG: ADYC domain-containing protein [Myxococcota bacterium]
MGLGLVGAAAACAPDDAPVVETVNLGLSIPNGLALNGTSFAAAPIEHISPEILGPFNPGNSGIFPTFQPPVFGDFNPYGGVGPNGTTTGGIRRRALRKIRITTDMTAEELIGAEIEGHTTNGKSALLKVTGIATGAERNADLIYYTVHAANGVGWQPLCGESGGEPIAALAVPGYWNHKVGGSDGGDWKYEAGEFTFVCRGSSVAKCMEAGYKPWLARNTTDGKIKHRKPENYRFENHLQACVRMLRADYCGDGVSHTRNGTPIDVWDTLGLHSRSRKDWPYEAAWSAGGAVWMRTTRHDDRVPSCFNHRREVFDAPGRPGLGDRQALFQRNALILNGRP